MNDDNALAPNVGSLPLHERSPCDMPADYIAQLTHELYARSGAHPDSRELHERAHEIKAEVTRRLRRLADAERLLEGVVKNVPIIEPAWRQTYLYERCKAFVGEANNRGET